MKRNMSKRLNQRRHSVIGDTAPAEQSKRNTPNFLHPLLHHQVEPDHLQVQPLKQFRLEPLTFFLGFFRGDGNLRTKPYLYLIYLLAACISLF